MGIEPTSEAWEASILPLYDARSIRYFVIIPKNVSNRTDAMRRFPGAVLLTNKRSRRKLAERARDALRMRRDDSRAHPMDVGLYPLGLQFDDEHFAAAFTLDGF